MGKFQGNYLTPARYRDAYIAAEQKVGRLKDRVEGVKTQMMLGDVETPQNWKRPRKSLRRPKERLNACIVCGQRERSREPLSWESSGEILWGR